jgi:hypothetical protein
MQSVCLSVALLFYVLIWHGPAMLVCKVQREAGPGQAQSQRKGSDMSNGQVLSALRGHDYQAIESVVDAPSSLLSEIEQALPHLDEEAREMAVGVIARGKSPDAVHLLLMMTADKSPGVSSSAANNIEKAASLPPAREILKAISRQGQPYIRGQLYLALGRAAETDSVEALRAQARNERDREAAENAQVALVKLGSAPERAAFLERIRETRPDDALRVSDQLLYVGDPRLAKGLLPWFSDSQNVTRLGGDRQQKMARVSDVAVWTSYRLGVKFRISPEYLTNYSDSVIFAARSAVEAL